MTLRADHRDPDLYLASRSPRRAELLRTLGVQFALLDIEIDETVRPGEPPKDYVLRLAREKAAAGRMLSAGRAPVLGADTSVVVDGEILGKPEDEQHLQRMLSRLSGRWHEVYTGVALAAAVPGAVCVCPRVRMRTLAAREIACYWASGEPADKAGGYAVQGLGGALVERLEGSYSNVVGLPLVETLALLSAARVPHALAPRASGSMASR